MKNNSENWIKLVAFLILCFVLICSLLKIWGAELTNDVLGLSLMILLIALFTDLKEFNFWGLKGKKNDISFKEINTDSALPQDNISSISKEDVDKAEAKPIQLMDNAQGNFLALAFEIERLLRIYATVSLNKDIPQTIHAVKLTKDLHRENFLTDNGLKQIDAIREVRNKIVHGRHNEIDPNTLEQGIQVAYNLYTELLSTLNKQSETEGK